jgi:hypothetical protein
MLFAGFWWGVVAGKMVENVIYLATVIKTDWQKEANEVIIIFFCDELDLTENKNQVSLSFPFCCTQDFRPR